MGSYTIEKTVEQPMLSFGVAVDTHVPRVANMFGLGVKRSDRFNILEKTELCFGKGQVVYITGASGAGKTVILGELKGKMAGVIDLADIELAKDRAVVDCFGDIELGEVLGYLGMAGLSDAAALLRDAWHLSEGQRYRFRLAVAMSRKPEFIFIDEFCSTLDRITAAVVAHNVRRFADKYKTTFVVATSHDDLLEDLAPDVVVIKHLGSGCDVYYPKINR